ncbi:MAG TPA: crossover junction endodeoxyribonuclease RuvC [Actinomycetota bacterium]
MFDRVVLGVDPGTASVGLAAVEAGNGRPVVRWAATLRTPSTLEPAARLRRIYGGVRDALDAHGAGVMALERLLWGRNTKSAMEVARASGVILLAAADAGLEVYEYAPLEVKMAVTGSGNAPKDQVRRALIQVLGTDAVPSEPDAADAVAVAVCHVQQSGLRRALEGAVR